MITKKNILITDIGSTTTKAVLFQKDSDSYKLTALKNIGTTVERPQEDVKIGILEANGNSVDILWDSVGNVKMIKIANALNNGET